MTPATPTLRLGTASPATQDTTVATLRQLAGIANRAGSLGVDILLLPEAYVGGYPRGSAFGSNIGNRTAEGREEFRQYFRRAVDLGDTVDGGAGAGDRWVRRELGDDGVGGSRGDGTREEMERIARQSGVFLVVGCIEKAGGSLYCSVVYVDPKKGIIGKRRKVMPTATERLIWAQGSPATLRAVSTTIKGVRVNLAAAICWESYMPLLRQALYAQNINLYLAPTADARDTWLGLMRTVAVEGRCFVVSSNMAVRNESKGERNGFGPREPATEKPERAWKVGGRRNSCFTKEGFEIALPLSPEIPRSSSRDITPPSFTKPQARRNSCFTEEGFEIALSPSPEFPRSSNGDITPPKFIKPQARRNSCFTEEGFEIALPVSPTTARSSNGDITPPKFTEPQARRNPCYTEEDFEIALPPSPENPRSEDGDITPPKFKQPQLRRNSCLTKEGFEIALPDPDHLRRQKRRKSVIVEDGHEIVLSCDDDTGARTPVTTNGHTVNGSENGFTSTWSKEEKAIGWVCRGGSCIVSPFGDVLAGPQWEDDEGIVWTDVDFEDCIRGRLDLDTAGSYSRNDAFKFSVEGLELDPLPY